MIRHDLDLAPILFPQAFGTATPGARERRAGSRSLMRWLLWAGLTVGAVLLSSTSAQAERADRHQPIEIDADRILVDDRERVHRFLGQVRLKQGTLEIRAEEVIVTQDDTGFKTGTAIGGKTLATFRQKKERSDEWITGEAERMIYDARAERLTLTGRARVTSGADEIRGAVIVYDIARETYEVTSAGAASSAPGGRVRAVIQPKNSAP